MDYSDRIPVVPDLETPLGIFQGDVIIRTAIVTALNDLRENPGLLDYVFRSLLADSLTSHMYGPNEIAAAKRWFLNNEISVFHSVHVPDSAMPPCITIELGASVENRNTLADLHAPAVEVSTQQWKPITERFNVHAYDTRSGQLTIPAAIANTTSISNKMQIVTASGEAFPIIKIISAKTFLIPPDTVADFDNCYLAATIPSAKTIIESAIFNETYHIGCHAIGEPVFMTYLHSIMTFVFLRYRQDLLEARGFQNTAINSSDFRKNELFDHENVFSRYITVTGQVQQSWPKYSQQTILSMDGTVSMAGRLRIIGGENVPLEVGQSTGDLLWAGELDDVTVTPETDDE